MVSFDVKSRVFLVIHTIDIIIKRIYEKYEISTVFTEAEMKKLLTICTKYVHFSFSNDVYIKIAMGSPLVPVIASIFMVELESLLVPKLNGHASKWRRIVDDIFVYVKRDAIECFVRTEFVS